MPVNKGNGIWKAIKNLFNIDFVEFNLEYADGHQEGRLQWNMNDGTLEVGMPGGEVLLQIGQENLVRVVNKTGSKLFNGQAVYVNGAQGSRPTVALAQANAEMTAITFAGILTEDIEDNASGYISTLGLVRDVDTSAFAEGSILYVSPTVAGGLTTTRPVHPNYTIGVGACLRSNANDGIIGVLSRLYPDASRISGTNSVWKDINIGGTSLGGPPGLQPGTVQYVDNLGANTGIYTYGLAVGEAVGGNFEIQHDYEEGSDFAFHFHFQGIAAPTGTDKLRFQLDYTIAKNGQTVSPVNTEIVEYDFDTQYSMNICSFGLLSGSGVSIGNQFLFTLSRIAATADEYAGEALLATVGIHYKVNSLGSRNIASKG